MPTQAKKRGKANLELDRSIVLVGLMGAGKTTIGKRLATVLDIPFIDSDNEIVEAAGCSVADIFEMYGEQVFRDLEKRVMKRLLSAPPCVLATGGGAFINLEIRKEIKNKALSVWLKAELDVLVERVSRRDSRPLLKKGDKREILERLMKERNPVYGEADIAVESDCGSHEAVVKTILQEIENWKQAA